MNEPREGKPRTADRIWFGLTALLIAIGLSMQIISVAGDDAGYFATPLSRIVNLFFYFTILSNLLLGISSLLLFLNSVRTSTAFAVLQMSGLIGITVTGVVYHGILTGLQEFHGWDLVADFFVHTIAPVMGVGGWLMFGPRGLISSRVVAMTCIFPLAFGVVSLVRGEIVGWYPYFFLDPNIKGYGTVSLYSGVIVLLFVCLAAGAKELDEWLSRF